jgi:predicted enzyme related to lactoylglutathione lyase
MAVIVVSTRRLAVPAIDNHEEGMFSYSDLQTSDLEAATIFYTDIFGWKYEDAPMSEDPTDIYRMFTKGGRVVCAASKQRSEQADAGVPPMWNVYFTVSDVEMAAKRCEAAGGTVHADPFDVFEAGRMAVVADPAGAFFCLWEPKENIGSQVMHEPNTLTWAESGSTDVEKVRAFYSEALGWTSEEADMGEGMMYTVFSIGSDNVAGMMKSPAPISYWSIYFDTDDCKGLTDKARAAGAQVMMDSDAVPGVGTISVLTDPQGAMFGLIQPEPAG